MPFSFIELKLKIFLTKLQNIKNLFFFNVKSFDFVIKKNSFPFLPKNCVVLFVYSLHTFRSDFIFPEIFCCKPCLFDFL